MGPLQAQGSSSVKPKSIIILSKCFYRCCAQQVIYVVAKALIERGKVDKADMHNYVVSFMLGSLMVHVITTQQ